MLPGVGFFGSGTLANVLIADLQEQGFKIMAIWSPNAEDAMRISHQRSIPFHSSVIDKVLLLPTVQLIVTACPPHYHNQIASKACGIGKHVVCDWPPSHSVRDCLQMQRAASNYPSLITLFLTGLRFVPTFQIMRKLLLEDQFIGQIRLINATVMCDVISVYKEKSIIWDNHMGGGLLSLYGTNIIDIIGFMTDCKAHRVHGMVHCLKQLSQNPILFNTTEDFVNFQMELYSTKHHQQTNNKMIKKMPLTLNKDDPIICNVTLNGHYYNSFPKHEIYIYGTKGYLVCRDGDIYAFKDNNFDNDGHVAQSTSANVSNHQDFIQETNTPIVQSKVLTSTTPNKEIQIYSINELDLWKSSSSLPSTSAYNSYVYPRIYLLGIRNMIVALKNAFFGPNPESNSSHSYTSQSAFPTNKVTTNLSSLNATAASVSGRTSPPTVGGQNSNGLNSSLSSSKITTIDHTKTNGRIAAPPPTPESSTSTAVDQQMVYWIKDPVNLAVNFDEGIYLQAVIEAIRMSSEHREWIRIHF